VWSLRGPYSQGQSAEATDVTDSATMIAISFSVFFMETNRLSNAGQWMRTRDSPFGTLSSDD
jgi:hypothetical protein